ncbi:hypothetical protein HPP92_006379 [Vanilla planifolia]|uniref:Uncharacterized protein n=1 Tax=Vanilla planifolia TaxID=51239 RepID=A0A835RBY1_VANPL|nr:hypothetical protein HPP92_006379 [Vanilla planifolia]
MSSELGDPAVFSMPYVSSQIHQPFNHKLQEIPSSVVVSSSPHRKPWPSTKVSQAEEAFNYTSNVLSYLQHHDKNENSIQDTALNIGMLEWRRLQKWIDQEEAEVNNSLLSPVHPFSKSPKNNVIFPFERKQSSSLHTSPLRSSAENNQPKGSRKDSSLCIIKSNNGSSSSTLKGSENIASPLNKVKSRVSRSVEVDKLSRNGHESGRVHLYNDRNEPKGQHLVAKSKHSQLDEDIREGHLCFDVALLDNWMPTKTSCGSLSRGNEDMYSQSYEDYLKPSRNSRTDMFHDSNGKLSFERGKELLPMILSRVDSKRMSPSPLKGASVADNLNVAVSRSNSKGRHSPLRQMFDPSRQSSFSVVSFTDDPDVAGSRGRRSPAKNKLETPRKSTSTAGLISANNDAVLQRSNSRGRRIPVEQMSQEVSCAIPKQSQSTKQALLKVSWKNGLPCLMFSSSDDNILVATMHKRGNSDMNICDCVYVIHTAVAVEVKKKNGAWLSQGTKNRKPEFACKLVAELVVSSSERVSFDLSHRSTLREFVLLGDELFPTNLVDEISLSSTELAAIMVESSHQKSGNSNCGVLCDCKVCIPRIVAILPSGVHGFSEAREPASLIERWESGGSCDCGGWDEGCMLTILTNNSQASKKSRSIQGHHQSVDGICGFNLFTEGDARKGKHSFSMVAFKEDMFTVEFRPSFPLLQAFAISIAMLHGRDVGDGVMRDYSIEDSSSEDLSFDDFPLISS